MKFRVTLKTPDALDDAIREAVDSLPVTDVVRAPGELEDERNLLVAATALAARRWFRHGEYLTVELDTERGTCTALEAPR